MKICYETLIIELSTIPGREKDNFEEIRAAFSYASDHQVRRILFPKGKFVISNEKAIEQLDRVFKGTFKRREAENVMAGLKNASDVEIEGDHTTLIFRGLIAPFDFCGCHNITVREITVDWERPVFSIGTVMESEEGTIKVKVDEAYPIAGGEPVASYQDYDVEKGVFSGFCIFEGVEHLTRLAPQTVILRNQYASCVQVGRRVIMRHIYSFSSCFHILECSDVSFEDVVIHTAPGMGIIAHKSSNLSFKNISVCPSGERLLSTNTDATHFISCFGEIQFDHCHFSFMGDDAVNVHGFYLAVKEIINSRELLLTVEASVQDDVFDCPDVLDKVEFVRRSNLSAYDEAQIMEIRRCDDKNKLVHVVLDRDLPEIFDRTDILANTSKTARLKFENCHVKNIRGRALLVQTRNALIENSTFENCTGQGVHIDTAEGWWESIGTRNITVRNNRFLDCGYGKTKYCDGVGVVIETECSNYAAGVHKDIKITDNYIKGNNTGILVRCAADVKIENNVFTLGEDCLQADIDDSHDVVISGGNLSGQKVRLGQNIFNVCVKE